MSNCSTSGRCVQLSEMFPVPVHACEGKHVCKALHSRWVMTSRWKGRWLLGGCQPASVVLLDEIGWRDRGINELLGLPGGRELHRGEGKGRRGFKSSDKAALSWEWKKLNIADEGTIVSNTQTHPSKISLLCSKICWTACLVTTGRISLSFLSPFSLASSPSVLLAVTAKCNHKKSDSSETKAEVSTSTVPISKTHSSDILMRHYCWHLLGKMGWWVQTPELPPGCRVSLEN